MDQAFFGPAGNSESFSKMGYRKNTDIPVYLSSFSLNAYEYQCGRGVKITKEPARALGKVAAENGIRLSLHAPYYISLSSVDPEKRDKSISYILQSAQAASFMGAQRIVVHSGSCTGMSRAEALELAKDTLKRAQEALDQQALGHIRICPETMGKINQLGDLYEVMELCLVDERFLPCIDFGHLNARTFGGLASKADFEHVLDTIHNKLGSDRLKIFHSHFSKIEFTEKGGEKRHLTFETTEYGPLFEPLAELVAKKNLTPTFICESAGTQAEDAQSMREVYWNALQQEPAT